MAFYLRRAFGDDLTELKAKLRTGWQRVRAADLPNKLLTAFHTLPS